MKQLIICLGDSITYNTQARYETKEVQRAG